jgi:hypothetical protein
VGGGGEVVGGCMRWVGCSSRNNTGSSWGVEMVCAQQLLLSIHVHNGLANASQQYLGVVTSLMHTC